MMKTLWKVTKAVVFATGVYTLICVGINRNKEDAE